YYILSQKKALKLLEDDINNNHDEDNSKLMIKDIKITKEQWENLQDIIDEFLNTVDNEKSEYNIQLCMSAIID
ncbi:hypothetical protein, partial [Mammaliicoccus stepanovicii]